jgi:NADPH:quinone reductase-like Zn-dependent oxidoreductase
MKAILCTRYGPPEVLQPAELPRPVPRDDEALIRIHCTTCHFGDVRVRAAMVPWAMQVPFRLFMGIRKPKRGVLGFELAGVVEGVGSAVTRFKPGDAVMAATGFSLGAYAEYICLPTVTKDIRRGLIVPKPAAMSFAEAAAGLATGGLTAFAILRKAGIRRRQRVLINGASGSVGIFAVQLARHAGAEVTGVCSTRNLDLVRSLGAHAVIDYTKGGLDACRDTFDVVFDTVAKLPSGKARKLAGPAGMCLDVARDARLLGRITLADLELLAAMVDRGELRTVIDREYTLDRIVEAHAYVQTERKRGHVVIHMGVPS